MTKRKIEIFSAGCPLCRETIDLVNELACSSCEIIIHDMHEKNTQLRAKELGIKSVPAVAINDVLAGCCQNRGVDAAMLKAGGIGTPL
ncbi:MAG: thioredoxin family protein [Candidatus Marinimicrobia bacterium]|nr:thioredoxin family protein [Candidatus Neomarinimicrobiota bacterium]